MSTEEFTSGNSGEETSQETSEVTVTQETTSTPKFLKKAILASKKYRKYVDILTVKLEKDVTYSAEEIDDIVKKFLKREISRKKVK